VVQGRRRPGRSSRYSSQPNKAIETGSATNTTSPATASTPTTATPGTATVPASLPARLSPGKAAGGQGYPPGTVPEVAAGRALAQERRLARARSSSRANSPAARTSAKTPTKARTLRTPLRIDGQPAQVSPAASLVGQCGRSAGSARGRGSACTALAGPPAGPLHPAGRPICWQDGG
jgi:hypothetical protein